MIQVVNIKILAFIVINSKSTNKPTIFTYQINQQNKPNPTPKTNNPNYTAKHQNRKPKSKNNKSNSIYKTKTNTKQK